MRRWMVFGVIWVLFGTAASSDEIIGRVITPDARIQGLTAKLNEELVSSLECKIDAIAALRDADESQDQLQDASGE